MLSHKNYYIQAYQAQIAMNFHKFMFPFFDPNVRAFINVRATYTLRTPYSCSFARIILTVSNAFLSIIIY